MKDEISETGRLLLAAYEALRARFGHRKWWPADTPFEMCVGAVLTQNTAWKNVTQAIARLKAAGALDVFAIHGMSQEELAVLIKPSGYYNVKAKRLKSLVRHIVTRHKGELSAMLALPVGELRKELLAINGVGKETADSIILYAANKPIFVVDAYTKRVLARHGLLPPDSDYDAVQEFFHRRLPRDAALFNDYHAQFVAVGKHYCKTKPACEECPLLEALPSPGAPASHARGSKMRSP
ncbi:MAG: endonuclease III domain-containing protein [Desulfomonilaceae bacterium]